MSSANKPLRPEWEDMQGLIASAYAHHPYADYLVLKIDDAAQTRRWLGALLADNLVTRALKHKHGHRDFQLNIAFTANALGRLASQADLTASAQFVEGMTGREHRSRMLGDTGESDPEGWRWGGPHQVDVLLMLFGRSQHSLAECHEQIQLDASGMSEVSKVSTGPFEGAKNATRYPCSTSVFASATATCMLP